MSTATKTKPTTESMSTTLLELLAEIKTDGRKYIPAKEILDRLERVKRRTGVEYAYFPREICQLFKQASQRTTGTDRFPFVQADLLRTLDDGIAQAEGRFQAHIRERADARLLS